MQRSPLRWHSSSARHSVRRAGRTTSRLHLGRRDNSMPSTSSATSLSSPCLPPCSGPSAGPFAGPSWLDSSSRSESSYCSSPFPAGLPRPPTCSATPSVRPPAGCWPRGSGRRQSQMIADTGVIPERWRRPAAAFTAPLTSVAQSQSPAPETVSPRHGMNISLNIRAGKSSRPDHVHLKVLETPGGHTKPEANGLRYHHCRTGTRRGYLDRRALFHPTTLDGWIVRRHSASLAQAGVRRVSRGWRLVPTVLLRGAVV